MTPPPTRRRRRSRPLDLDGCRGAVAELIRLIVHIRDCYPRELVVVARELAAIERAERPRRRR